MDTAVPARVLRCFRNWTDLVVDVRIGTETLRTTRGHPFFALGHGWLEARSLRAGDRLCTLDGAVEVVGRATSAETMATYNLEIGGHHTYFVGTAAVLVHNQDTRNWADTTRRVTRIYVVVDRSDIVDTPLGPRPRVIYVGKTSSTIGARFTGHLSVKPSWRHLGDDIAAIPVHEYFGWQDPIEGNWTKYETAVWEQHFIEVFGGTTRDNRATAYGATLENEVRAIGPDKFRTFKEGYGHNPCR
jgi:hypothetical protein